jgi:NAD(P)-dependent dehydrogenase (short-subunit alcohol dehydrogenase family)
VTGGTSGLGRAMAEALIEAGARVAIASRDRSRADAVAAQLGSAATGLELDVRVETSAQSAVDEVYQRLGGLDVLVNNAGIGLRTVNPRFMTNQQPFWDVTPSGFRDVMETKATGCFLVARAVVPRMLEAGFGRLVTISMNQSTMVRRGFVPYGPSGAAVEALARVMAADLAGTPVTANILLPGGATETGMVPDDVRDESGRGCSIRRSWARRSSGFPRRKSRMFTTSASSPQSSTSGWRNAELEAPPLSLAWISSAKLLGPAALERAVVGRGP